MPPRMNIRNIWEGMKHPVWGMKTLYHGIPNFAMLKPYMPPGFNMEKLGEYMN